MKILIVFNHPAPYKVNVFNELNKLIPIDVVFERCSAKNRNKKFYEQNKYEFNHFFLKKGAFGEENSLTLELVNFLKNNKYDLVIMNGYSTLTELLAISYLNFHKIDWCLFINGGIIKNDSDLRYWIKKRIISSASYYLSPCPESNEYLIHYGAKNRNIFSYPNSTVYSYQQLDRPLTKQEKNQLREKLNLPIDKKIFISPCQFINRKNNVQLIRSFINKEEVLLLIGSGVQQPLYETIIKENSMNNVIILPYKSSDELNEYYKASDCFITLSKQDIYGHTTNEAMSQGIPCISSDNVISSLHLIKNGYNGYIVNVKKQEEIDNAISKINESMNKNALSIAKENTIEKQARAIYEAILEMTK